MTLTLSIKKQFFEEILRGTKRVEYRSATDYYQKRLLKRPTRLRLHFYTKRMLTADIVRISRIRTPSALKKTGIDFGSHVYAIHLKNARRIR